MSKKPLPYGINYYPPRKYETKPRYRVKIWYERQQHHVGIFETRKDAEKALKKARRQKSMGTFIPPAEVRRRKVAKREKKKRGQLTVKQWSKEWMRQLEAQGRSAGTLRTYRSRLNTWIIPTIGYLPLSKVTDKQVAKIRVKVEAEGVQWLGVRTTLGSMLKAAKEQKVGGIKKVPNLGSVVVPRRNQVSGAKKVATPKQVKDLAAAMPDEYALTVTIAAWGALRIGEVLGLTRDSFRGLGDADTPPNNPVVIVSKQWSEAARDFTPPKSGSVGEVAIPSSLAVQIRKHLDAYVGQEAWAPLFPSPLTPSRPVSHAVFNKYWSAARDEVLPGFTFHALRHTGLTRAAQTGATLAELQRRGRHANATVALRYQQSEDSRDRAIADALDVIMREGDTPGTELTGV